MQEVQIRAEAEKNNDDQELRLGEDESGLFLESNGMKMRGDLVSMIPRLKASNLNRELLVRAAAINKIRKSGCRGEYPTAVDATAGMGEDAILLAAAGFHVLMFEKNPVIAKLLKDSLERAARDPSAAGMKEIFDRMQLIEGDSIQGMRELAFSPDIIYLDPMFPRRMKSGLVKKKFQLIHQLEKPCENEEELLNAAIFAEPGKIIIKRHAKGPFFAGRKPSYSISGKEIRYDCIVFPLSDKGKTSSCETDCTDYTDQTEQL